MKDFDTIIQPLLEIKYRIKHIEIGKPPVVRSVKGDCGRKPVITPEGEFNSVTAAANHYMVKGSSIIWRIKNKEGYKYVEDNR